MLCRLFHSWQADAMDIRGLAIRAVDFGDGSFMVGPACHSGTKSSVC